MVPQSCTAKGMSNSVDDRGLYPHGMSSIKSDSWMYRGKVIAHAPLVGIANVNWRDWPTAGSLLFLCLLWLAVRRNRITPVLLLSICAVVHLLAKPALGSNEH
jgi:hypothetical protein